MNFPVLIRKVDNQTWPNTNPANRDEDPFKVDAFKTISYVENGELSFWRAETEADFKLLEMSFAASIEPAEIALCCLPEKEILALNIKVAKEPGKSPITAARSKHVNLKELDCDKLVALIQVMWKKSEIVRINKSRVIQLTKEAIESRLLQWEQLKPEVRYSRDFFGEQRSWLDSLHGQTIGSTTPCKVSIKPIRAWKVELKSILLNGSLPVSGQVSNDQFRVISITQNSVSGRSDENQFKELLELLQTEITLRKAS